MFSAVPALAATTACGVESSASDGGSVLAHAQSGATLKDAGVLDSWALASAIVDAGSHTVGAGSSRGEGGRNTPQADGGDSAAAAVARGDASDATAKTAHGEGGAAASDAGSTDSTAADGAPVSPDAGVVAPALLYVGRFDTSDPAGPQMGWPGTQVVAQFNGTGVEVQLTQTDGYSGGPSWFNVVLDGVEGVPFSLEGTSVVIPLASGLAFGRHAITLEKRTEANLGTVRFEGFTFTGGSGLLPPRPRASHRIEFMSDSTIDGYGVLGNIATTCVTGDPAEYNDSRSSLAFFTASASDAEMVLSAYSGKGLTMDEDPSDTEVYPILYPRGLPDSAASVWPFLLEIPDAVVMSLGGVDFDGLSTAPPGFQVAYDTLVGTVRAHYPTAAIWLTVWSQILDVPVATRTAMTSTLQAIVSARAAAGDGNVFLYVFPEAVPADETGCEGHASLAHEQAMAALMTAEIDQRLGW